MDRKAQERDVLTAAGWRPDGDGWTKRIGEGRNQIRAVLRPTIAGTWTWETTCGETWRRAGRSSSVIDAAQMVTFAADRFNRDREERPRPKW